MELAKKIMEYLKKYGFSMVLVFILFVILIPLSINWCYKQNWEIPFLQMQWEGKDALAFYGAILAAMIGIIGVFLSIQYAQKSYKNDLKHQVLPYFSIIRLKGISHYNILGDLAATVIKSKDTDTGQKVTTGKQEQDNVAKSLYEEIEITKAYFIIEKGKIRCYDKLSEEQQDILNKAGFEIKKRKDAIDVVQAPYISSPLVAENVGNGAAICTRIGFFKQGDTPEYLQPIQFRKNDRFYIHIFSTVPPDEVQGEYVLSFVYQDIYKNKYKQDFPYIATKKEYSLSLDAEQERL